MKKLNHNKRSSLKIAALLAIAAILSAALVIQKNKARQYSSGLEINKDEDGDNGALGMMQYFFNARKNVVTNKMDYAAMAASNIEANRIMMNSINKTARTASGLNMSWTPMGPANVGGRTRAILFDNRDASHNTIFACAVSGGIWRSKNGGQTWDSVPGNDQLSSLNASCIAQDANGVLYLGTGEGFSLWYGGEGFSTAMIGGGIFKSTDDGNTWTVIPSTVPPSNSWSAGWAYVNRIAVDPNNASNVYAATYGGLMYSSDGGTTWLQMHNSATNNPLGGISLDVKMSEDGTVMYAFAGSKLWYAYPNSSLVTKMTQVSGSVHDGGVYSNCSRIEIAISPSNPNYAYVSAIGLTPNTNFGAGAVAGTGIYMTMTAKTAGGYWYLIGPGGSNTFDPYSSAGIGDQTTYDNTLGVSPYNPGHVFVGGTVLWSWSQSNAGDTVGGWTNLSTYFGVPGYPSNYIHPDEHAITFSPSNPNVIYNGNDGGIYISTDNGITWKPINRNYNVTQFDAIAFSPFMSSPAQAGQPGEGVMGGTQDNGTPYINGLQSYYEDAVSVGGGDGGRSAMSQLDPNIYFVTGDNSTLYRGGNLNTLGSTANLYTNTKGLCLGGNIDSVIGNGSGGCFYHQIALYENSFDTTKNLDMMKWIADSNYSAGKTVYPVSANGNVPFPYKLKSAVSIGETLTIKNAVISKLACGFSATNGVWLMMQAADLTDPIVWMPIGGPDSKPDAFKNPGGPLSPDPIHAMAWSPDGDALFVGTEGGQLYRFSNLDSVEDNDYCTGALWSEVRGGGVVANPQCRVISTKLGNYGRDILSIAVDPNDGNKVLVTLGNYNNATYLYYSSNALSASPRFVATQGTGLPAMPVYSSILDIRNSGQPNSAVIGTERGIYSTTNIGDSSNTTWTYSSGMANSLVLDLKQQTLPPWNCNNSGNIYVGTHGRGAWVSNNFYQPLNVKPVVADVTAEAGLKVYPNPMNSMGTIEFYLPAESEKVNVSIYDITGRAIKTIELENQAKGQHMVTINSGEFDMGTYIACVSGNNFRKSVRFVVVK